MTKIYRTIPSTVEALQVTADNVIDVANFAGEYFMSGMLRASETDWIVKREDEFIVLTDEDFNLTYRE